MKKVLVFLLIVICCAAGVFFFTRKETPVPLSFDGHQYFLQYSVENAEGWFNQYLLPQEDPLSTRYMFTVRTYDNTTQEPQQIGNDILDKLLQNYPDAKYSFYPWQNGDSGLYFILPTEEALEFHLFRFTRQTNGKPLEMQFVDKVFINGDEQQAWQEMSDLLDKDMTRWVPTLMAMPLPEVIRQNRG